MKQLSHVRLKAELLSDIFVFCFCLLSLQGCDLFRTRMPEEPDIGRANYVPATEPSLVFQNLKNAFADKNVVNYSKAFADSSFTFVPSPGAQSSYAALFLQWTVDHETQYFNNLCNKTNPVLEWLSLREESRSATTVQYECTYRLSGLPDGKNAEGKAQLFLILTSSQVWVIERWMDYELSASTTLTWSMLKAMYIQ